jgi:hypothetical protein
MIHEEKCYMATCDNCGEIFNDGEYSMYPLASDVLDAIRNDSEWYAGDADPDHQGKHYCFDCFKYHPEIDDKIIVDESRKVPNSDKNLERSVASKAQSMDEPMVNKVAVAVKEDAIDNWLTNIIRHSGSETDISKAAKVLKQHYKS